MKKAVKKAYAVLETDRQIVGVKLAQTKEEFNLYHASEITAPLAYCVCVKSAMNGVSLKFTAENSECLGSTRALGLEKPEKGFYDGSEGCMLGLYDNKSVAAAVAKSMQTNKTLIYGVIVKPLELFENDPDIVLIVSNTKNIMRIIQGYTYMHGMQSNFNMIGNQAVCVECTIYPMQTNNINISMFCSGTRYLAKWKDTEAMVGIPFKMFSTVIEGIRQTVNAVEMNGRKQVIEERLHEAGFLDMEIIYDKTYYTELEKQKVQRRKSKRIASQKNK